jgi:hypothetical protein
VSQETGSSMFKGCRPNQTVHRPPIACNARTATVLGTCIIDIRCVVACEGSEDGISQEVRTCQSGHIDVCVRRVPPLCASPGLRVPPGIEPRASYARCTPEVMANRTCSPHQTAVFLVASQRNICIARGVRWEEVPRMPFLHRCGQSLMTC